MGSVKQLPTGKYQARVRPPEGGNQVRRTFALLRDANAWVATMESGKLKGEWVNPASGKVTVKEYGEQWRATLVHRPSSERVYESHLRLHVYPTLGKRPLGSLRTSELRTWAKGLSAILAPITVTSITDQFRGLLGAAVADNLIASNPMDGVKVARPDKELVRPLTPEQVGALLGAIAPRYRGLVAMGAGCGLRISEALALGPESVDFLRHKVRVTRQTSKPKGERAMLTSPKTPSSVREVPFSGPVSIELAEHLRQYRATEVELTASPLCPGGRATLYFTTEAGEAYTSNVVGQAMMVAVKRAGLPAGTTFHDLRHHFASLLIMSGLSPKAVQVAMGHATNAETMDTYGHLFPSEEDRMAGAIERAWVGAPLLGGGQA